MDESLARGHATAYVQKKTDHGSIRNWLESPRRAQAFKKFALSAQMNHEGQVIETMTPLLCPPFSAAFVPFPWNKMAKSVAAQLVTAAPETEVFLSGQSDELDFEEKSVFLNDLIYLAAEEKVECTLLTVANMGHHAIKRLLQRGLADEKSLDRIVWLSMSIARDLGQIFSLTSLKQDGAFEFFIPFMGGAFVAQTKKVSPGIAKSYQGDQWVLSLRTFYEKDMLKPGHLERMAGMNIEEDGTMRLLWLGQTREMQRGMMHEADVNHIRGWLQANARPTRPKSGAR